MTNYGWIITHDYLEEQNVAIIGPRNISDDIHTQLLSGQGTAFRMYDDDGELYFEGRIIGSDNDDYPEWEFSPLTQFGGPDSGCTEIRYMDNNGKWVML